MINKISPKKVPQKKPSNEWMNEWMKSGVISKKTGRLRLEDGPTAESWTEYRSQKAKNRLKLEKIVLPMSTVFGMKSKKSFLGK